jgi:hypothetical protein
MAGDGDGEIRDNRTDCSLQANDVAWVVLGLVTRYVRGSQ